MEQERAPCETKNLFTKRGNIAWGAYFIKRSRKTTTNRGTYVSERGNKNMHVM